MKYFPFRKGYYDTSAGLIPFKPNYSNHTIFDIDENYNFYIKNKKKYLELCPDKHFRSKNSFHLNEVADYILDSLLNSYKDIFSLEKFDGYYILKNNLNNQSFVFDKSFISISQNRKAHLFDFICENIQEDIAIWQLTKGVDSLSVLHVCSPNNWRPEEKIGKSFSFVHEEVPKMEKLNKKYKSMLNSIINGNSFYRFVWDLVTDSELNHHPDNQFSDGIKILRKNFTDPKNQNLYFRFERQNLIGLKKLDTVLFTIRTYIYDIREYSSDDINLIAQSVKSMSDDILKYKGIYDSKKAILNYLNSLA